MRHSRYIWVIGLILIAFIGIMAWESPQVVWTTLADPGHNDSARATVQHFWSLMDARQLNLARNLLTEDSEQALTEFRNWQERLAKDPFLSVQRLEFVATEDPQTIVTRVYWNSLKPVTFHFSLQPTNEGWRIIQMHRTDGLSLVGGNNYGEFLRT